ncbi:unnamed protein product [Ostreobium quekettii]|uniref:Uncharacterized protein n=1 Tax=Ostreobium quekettii TaxID=121088 RepID=A0A8S1IQF5_9CHLO|nr:unnamed protein product [Ostreobium quekettii]
MMCHGSEGTGQHNTTIATVATCTGNWTVDGGGYNPYEAASGRAACSGAFFQKTLASMRVDEQPMLLATQYSCMLNFNYESTVAGEAKNTSTMCQHVESVTAAVNVGTVDGDLTEERMESMLEDVLPDGDSSGPPESSDRQGVDDRQWPLDQGGINITCNGAHASMLAPCHGTLQLALEGSDFNATETCQGWWIPVLVPRVTLACAGQFDAGVSSKAGGELVEAVSICTGHHVLVNSATFVRDTDSKESRDVCVGSSRKWHVTKSLPHWDDATVAST